MRAVDIITRKRDKHELTNEEINFFIQGFTRGEIPDYQASALAMAICLNGMSLQETTDLTLSMARSGQTLDLSDIAAPTVDKHSSGGVGDKTTLVVLPIAAACGLACGKMSGRGLGFSGGTLDKLESIPGYRTDLTSDEFQTQLRQIGIVLTGQSLELAPADGKLYALRDVTGTVDSIPLIASSIMSKKLAAGAQSIVLDVKVGHGAFMQTVEAASQLAETMCGIGRLAGRNVSAFLSDMNQPLGAAVGNALEVKEAIDTLNNGGPPDFREHCLAVASEMLLLSQRAANTTEARQLATESLASGAAFEKFCQLVRAQGGNLAYVRQPGRLPQAEWVETVWATRKGHMAAILAGEIGRAAVLLGAGRAQKSDPIDHAVGLIIHKKVGDPVSIGDALFSIHARSQDQATIVRKLVHDAFQISEQPVARLPLFYNE